MRSLPAKRSSSARLLRSELKRNFVVLFFHGMLGQTGFQAASGANLPAHLHRHLDRQQRRRRNGKRAIQSLGSFVSPMVSARMIEHRTHVKRMGIGVGAL